MRPYPTTIRPLVRLTAALLLAAGVGFAAEAGGGSITGYVSNAATGTLLEGARVEVSSLGAVTLTDNTGRYI